MEFRARFDWAMRVALLVFILAAAAFLSAITAMRLAIQGREVEMPKVMGKSAADAQAILAGRGLGFRVADRVYSDLPVNHVVRQSPSPRTHMKVAQKAHVVLSLGRREISIPALEGRSLRAARIELLRSGLQAGEISNVHLPDFPVDVVVLQNPRPGSNAASPRVNLLVSQGPRETAYVMPHLVGLSQAEAQRQLEAAGLRLVKITFSAAPEWPHGTVFEQTPPFGARIAANVNVEMRVAE